MTDGERGPVHDCCEGRYYAEIRAGVPMIRRADSCGAVYAIEWDDDEQRYAWEEAIRADERKRIEARG